MYQLECGECGESRVGRQTDEGIRPVREKCPKCGGAEYDVSAYDSEE